jgi:dTDP-4-dehydrorhamnose reductase
MPGDAPRLEVWGGIECTINRVGETYFDQLHRTGHLGRPDDLDRFADLGIRAIRYPVLWEHIAPNGLDDANWSWPDRQLKRLRELNIRPIVGLVHHGSGPRDTDLNDPGFPERLAAFAEAVSRRYPWIEDYTPVNEPLTTARFSSLYGHWYPHNRDDHSFARALLGQAKAVVLAMQRIRQVNPAARLIQTDDLGRTYASDALQYQADFENERRWLTFDLLTGTLTAERCMWHWLRQCGISEGELEWFETNRSSPDVIGVNTYLSSERFIDERTDLYPGELAGTNGRHTYVDVLAARVLPHGILGTRGLLGEAWRRYGLPLAVTEVHNGGEREEQLRWLDEVWRGADAARGDGADVRAVTVWALLGLYDWPSLVTRFDNVYEPGVFDVRGPSPRPTAIARMVRDLARLGEHRHPVLDLPGWWRRADRFTYKTVPELDGQQTQSPEPASPHPSARPVLLVGGQSRLRTALEETLRRKVIPFRVIDRDAAIDNPAGIGEVIDESRAWAVVDSNGAHCSWMDNTIGTRPSAYGSARLLPLASVCADRDVPLVCFSWDELISGADTAGPCRTGTVKRDAAVHSWSLFEASLLRTHGQSLIIRSDFGVVPDPFGDLASETFTPDQHGILMAADISPGLGLAVEMRVADTTVDMLIDGVFGVWLLKSRNTVSTAAEPQLVPEEIVNREVLNSTLVTISSPAPELTARSEAAD